LNDLQMIDKLNVTPARMIFASDYFRNLRLACIFDTHSQLCFSYEALPPILNLNFIRHPMT